MRIWIVSIVCLASALSSNAQGIGIGMRLGEPTGFSFKQYMPNGKAIEISAGATGYLYNRGYAQGKWESGGLSLMGNYLWQQALPKGKGLEWYAGAGASAKLRSFRYDEGFGEGGGTQTRISFGVNAVAGLEYSLPKAPVSLFLDIIPYIELAPYPGRPGIDGGLGARYNF